MVYAFQWHPRHMKCTTWTQQQWGSTDCIMVLHQSISSPPCRSVVKNDGNKKLVPCVGSVTFHCGDNALRNRVMFRRTALQIITVSVILWGENGEGDARQWCKCSREEMQEGGVGVVAPPGVSKMALLPRCARGRRTVQTLGICGDLLVIIATRKRPPGKNKNYPDASVTYWQP